MLSFIASYQRDPAHTSILPGFGLCAALFLTALAQTAILHQYFQLCIVTGSRVRAGLVMVIYNKSLVLSNDDGDDGTKEDGKDKTGEKKEGRRRGDVVNLMSVDTTRMQDLCTYGLIIASGPFQVSLIADVPCYCYCSISYPLVIDHPSFCITVQLAWVASVRWCGHHVHCHSSFGFDCSNPQDALRTADAKSRRTNDNDERATQ